eukprot:527754-Rhodomonas_salina.1
MQVLTWVLRLPGAAAHHDARRARELHVLAPPQPDQVSPLLPETKHPSGAARYTWSCVSLTLCIVHGHQSTDARL